MPRYFWVRDPSIVRQMVGGLGVLLLVAKAVTVLSVLLVYGVLEHGPVEVTCLVLGLGSVLAARYLPDDPRDARGLFGRKKSERKMI